MRTMTFKPDSVTTEYIEASPDGIVFYARVYTPHNDPSVHFPSHIIDEVVLRDVATEPLV